MFYQLKRNKEQQSVKATGTLFLLPVSNSENCYKTTTVSGLLSHLPSLLLPYLQLPVESASSLMARIPDLENN